MRCNIHISQEDTNNFHLHLLTKFWVKRIHFLICKQFLKKFHERNVEKIAMSHIHIICDIKEGKDWGEGGHNNYMLIERKN